MFATAVARGYVLDTAHSRWCVCAASPVICMHKFNQAQALKCRHFSTVDANNNNNIRSGEIPSAAYN